MPRVKNKKSPELLNLKFTLSLYRPPLRPGYREREWDSRDRDRSGSRDRIDDPYRRPGYDRPPYERSGLDRSAPERYPHTSSPLSMSVSLSVKLKARCLRIW